MATLDKTVLIIGGASGIGQACVDYFHQEGYHVIVADLDVNRATDVHSDKDNISVIPFDAFNTDQIKSLTTQVLDESGGLDHLVYTPAGIHSCESEVEARGGATTLEMTDDAIKFTIDHTLTPFMFVTKYFGNMMKDNPRENQSLTVMGSINDTGRFGQAPYSASKAGLAAFVKVAANDLGKYGIRVNIVAPGSTDTPATRREGMDFDAVVNQTGLGRVTMPYDIAKAVYFLTQNAAISGQELVVDSLQANAKAPPRY